MREQVPFAHFSLDKAFEKQTKTIKEQGGNQIDAKKHQNRKLEALNDKDNHKSIYF